MPQAVHTVRRLCRSALSDLLPAYCDTEVGAAVADGWHIDTPDAYCHRCGATTGPGAATTAGCAFCLGQPVPWDTITRLNPYVEPINRWIIAMKFSHRWMWARWFGNQLADRLSDPYPHDRVVVCPVPMHWTRRLYRGYNQAQLMAEALAQKRRWRVVPLLRRTRRTRSQTSLPPSQRHANVRGAFAVKPIDLTDWRVCLVDDVKTTGSTLGACAKLLRRAGAAHIHAVVTAVGDPRGMDFTTT